MHTQTPPHPSQPEQELDRISQDLKVQVRMAKDRISDRYAKLMEKRSFEPEAGRAS